MRFPPHFARIGVAAAFSASLLVGAPAAFAAPHESAPVPSAAVAVAPAAVGDICQSELPPEAHDTLDLIEQGGPYPYPQDGQVFENREGLLPDQDTGYYHEYTVETPGSDDRGAKRIVTGDKDEEDYYTEDHYESFDLVDYSC
ncbi:ribonuclease domain-containing protein [Streptomyces oceani]|uniref:Ribonuclease n=1 Tax=Streptomyces oceani TaxID=1075402 RepID=A0A1E7KKP0_9ACTN|nr:ribonuclease [Streptomyces oceani]OEV04381.1 ribonuclease [Streptomyces oceani]